MSILYYYLLKMCKTIVVSNCILIVIISLVVIIIVNTSAVLIINTHNKSTKLYNVYENLKSNYFNSGDVVLNFRDILPKRA